MSRPRDPGLGDPKCVWIWPGESPWAIFSDTCTGEDTCSPPQNPGSFVGEKETTPCEMND